jgi:probable HAF family extracellular repeat protein
VGAGSEEGFITLKWFYGFSLISMKETVSKKGRSDFTLRRRYMTRKLFHSLAILALTFLVGQCQVLIAQSAPAATGVINAPFGAHPGFPGVPVFQTGARQKSGSHSDAAPLGLTKQKVYQFRTVDFPAATSSLIYDFADGKAAGTYAFSSSETAFYFEGITNHTLKVPGATASAVYGVNASGHMVGGFNDTNGSRSHGFLYDGTNFVTLDDPAGSVYGTNATGINDAGVIVGTYNDMGDVPHGFLYINGNFNNFDCPNSVGTNAWGINSSGQIVGFCWYNSTYHGFLLSNDSYTAIDFPQAALTYLYGINDAGAVAGTFEDAAGKFHGFTYSGGLFNQVDVLGGTTDTFLIRVKNNGAVVGFAYDSLNESHGIIGH